MSDVGCFVGYDITLYIYYICMILKILIIIDMIIVDIVINKQSPAIMRPFTKDEGQKINPNCFHQRGIE